jgi:Tfp pilus assembly protein PilO
VKTKNMMVGTLVVLLVGALWYRVVYSPMESKATKAKSAAQDADLSAANVRKALADAGGSSKNTKSHDPSAEVMLAAIPADTAQATFLRNLDALRLSTGAAWQSVSPTPPVAGGTVTTINVAVTVQGTQQQLAAYLTGLADMRRLFVVDNVSVNPSGSNTAAGTAVRATPGNVFLADQMAMQISGRIFAGPAAVAAAGGTAGTATTPVTGTPAPTGGATSPPGTQSS